MAKFSKAEIAESREMLSEILKPGQTVFCILRHRAASGMSRVIQLVTFIDGEPRYLGFHAARLIGWTYDRKKEGIRVSGCGMDMGFHVVYTLGAVLWPNGTPEPHSSRNGEPDRAGGYALRSSWL